MNYRTFDAEVREQALRDAYRDYGATMRDEFIYKEPLGEINTRELAEKMLDDIQEVPRLQTWRICHR